MVCSKCVVTLDLHDLWNFEYHLPRAAVWLRLGKAHMALWTQGDRESRNGEHFGPICKAVLSKTSDFLIHHNLGLVMVPVVDHVITVLARMRY